MSAIQKHTATRTSATSPFAKAAAIVASWPPHAAIRQRIFYVPQSCRVRLEDVGPRPAALRFACIPARRARVPIPQRESACMILHTVSHCTGAGFAAATGAQESC